MGQALEGITELKILVERQAQTAERQALTIDRQSLSIDRLSMMLERALGQNT
ncbi:MAG: hypothetical protein F6K47_17380 [Symploca sp. SIO2E6]|nr:hypothetical protein [Symploca sp. SIO2E6]